MEEKCELLVHARPQTTIWLSGRECDQHCFTATELGGIFPPSTPSLIKGTSQQPHGCGVAADAHVPASLPGVSVPGANECDALTGLPRLTEVSGLISRLISEAEVHRQALAVVSFDLDGCQSLSERCGCADGDAIIKSAAAMLAAIACPRAVIVRHGDYGFTAVLAGLSGASEIAICVQQVLDAIAAPHEFGDITPRSTPSAGVALFPKDGENFATLSRNARGAMRESKVKCPGALRFHSGHLGLVAKRRLRLEIDLRRAIENHELTLFYQPQFEISNGRACGVEVLARWFRGNSAVDPSVFIPLAEQSKLIATLGSWVLHEACTAAQAWRTRSRKSMTLCVNVSPLQLDEAFPSVIQQVLDDTGFPPERLELEITESALIGNTNFIIECFHHLKAIGVRIAIDDFGIGYSSLSYLSRLPVDRLKLDKSLVQNLTTQWKDVAILRAIIALAHDLAIDVIAEGVETEQQLQVLKRLHCPQAQGYLLARPAPHAEARDLLAKRWGARPPRRRVAMT
jgi:diguanylate cyclase (GGDEF)-like protein